MRSTVIIYKRGDGYVADARGEHGGGSQGARAGLTPQDAATFAARAMLRLSADNPDGGDLMAPSEVMELVPPHLRKIDGRPQD